MRSLFVLCLLLPQVCKALSLSLGIAGITSHMGGIVNHREYKRMHRRISKEGLTVLNPELNISIEYKDFLLNNTWISDCYGLDAYYSGIGYQLELDDKLYFVSTIGAYFRTKFHYSSDYSKIRSTKKEILFSPFIGIQKDFKIKENFYFFTSLHSNYFLTHAMIGFKILP